MLSETWLRRIEVIAVVGSLLATAVSLEFTRKQLQLTNNEIGERHEAEKKARELAETPLLYLDRIESTYLLKSRGGGELGFALNEDGLVRELATYPSIRNTGQGTAIKCKVELTISKIDGKPTAEVDVSESASIPANIGPGQTGHFFVLPHCFARASGAKKKEAEGTVTITCETVSGAQKSFSEPVKLVLDAQKPDEVKLHVRGVLPFRWNSAAFMYAE